MRLRKLLNWRAALIYIHRWLGITGSLLFAVWFASGIVFMYVGMPALAAEERLLRMEPLDVRRVAVAPGEAAARIGVVPARVRVAMHAGRPAYRFHADGVWRLVYADTGEPLEKISAVEAVAVMRRYAPEHAATLRHVERLADSDQWTLQRVTRSQMPMHRIALGDAAGTEYYVSERSGEPVLRTTASGRTWGYLSAVLHWLYFTPVRRHVSLWNALVLWAALIGTVMCALGLVTGVWRYSIAKRFRLRRVRVHSPYAGWMKWHHYAGLLFGLFACTWALSGALSLAPFAVLRDSPATAAQRDAASGGPIDLAPLTVDRLQRVAEQVSRSFTPKELDFFQFQREPYFIAYAPPAPHESAPWRNTDVSAATSLHIDRAYVLISVLRPERGTFTSFEKNRMWDVARAAMPGAPMRDGVWLYDYDAYYYSRNRSKPLPVLRVRYDDPQQTWLYLDPAHGALAARLERAGRWNRWLYHGFHSLDFPFLYYQRPLWDAAVILLSVGGIALSVTSAVPAWRRLARHARAWSRSFDRASRIGGQARQ